MSYDVQNTGSLSFTWSSGIVYGPGPAVGPTSAVVEPYALKVTSSMTFTYTWTPRFMDGIMSSPATGRIRIKRTDGTWVEIGGSDDPTHVGWMRI